MQFIQIKSKIVKVLPKAVQRKLPREIGVFAVPPRVSRELNRRYQKKDQPTNVLSFRYGADYGEILVCPTVVQREAKVQGHTYEYQVTWMILHGTLHLAGVHHEGSPRVAALSERIERSALERMARRLKNTAA